MEAAERLGISLKRFYGWEPRTAYEYDGDRLAASVVEQEWDEDERAWMLALGLYRDLLCPVCGGPADECQSPQTLDEAKNGRYLVDAATCLRTKELRQDMDRMSERVSEAESAALVFTTRRRE